MGCWLLLVSFVKDTYVMSVVPRNEINCSSEFYSTKRLLFA